MPGFNMIADVYQDAFDGCGRYFWLYDSITNLPVSYSFVDFCKVDSQGHRKTGASFTFYVGRRYTKTTYISVDCYELSYNYDLPQRFNDYCYDAVVDYHLHHLIVPGEVCEEEAWVLMWKLLKSALRNNAAYPPGSVGHRDYLSATNQLRHLEQKFYSLYMFDVSDSEYNEYDDRILYSVETNAVAALVD